MKKTLCILAALVLMLCGCGKNALRGKTTADVLGEAIDAANVTRVIHIRNHETHEETETDDPEAIAAFVEALGQIKIKEKTDLWATDSDDIFRMEMTDGQDVVLSFNGRNLKVDDDLYVVDGATALWDWTREQQ